MRNRNFQFKMFFKLLFFSYIVLVSSDFHLIRRDEENLPDIIPNQFHPIPIPHGRSGLPLLVNLSVHIVHFSVNTAKQEFEITMYFRQGWEDSRLAFYSEDPWKYRLIHDQSSIWMPDLFFVNEIITKDNLPSMRSSFIRVYPNGNILISQRLSITASCPMDLRIYPFDTQVCQLQIESYGYTTNDMIVEWNRSTEYPVTGDPTVMEFEVEKGWRSSRIKFNGDQYDRSVLEFKLKRSPSVIIFRILIPVSTVIIFSWASFFFSKKDVSLRLTLCLSPIIAYLLQLNISNIFFVKPGYPTGLDIWVAFCFIAMLAAFFECIYVMGRTGNVPDSVGIEANIPPTERSERLDMKTRIIFAVSFVLFNIFCAIYISLAQF